jgi:hypothetical protein
VFIELVKTWDGEDGLFRASVDSFAKEVTVTGVKLKHDGNHRIWIKLVDIDGAFTEYELEL